MELGMSNPITDEDIDFVINHCQYPEWERMARELKAARARIEKLEVLKAKADEMARFYSEATLRSWGDGCYYEEDTGKKAGAYLEAGEGVGMKLSNPELAEIYNEISNHPRVVSNESLNKLAQHINYFEDRVSELERIHAIDTEYIGRSQANDERLCARIAELERENGPDGKAYKQWVEQTRIIAERDALIRELIKVVEELQGGFIRIEGHVTPTDKLLAKAKGVVGDV